MSKDAQKKKKEDWALEKPKQDNARKLSGTCFIDPENAEYKETMKNAKKLEIPVEAAMPCKMGTRKRLRKLRGTVSTEDTNPRKKTKYGCIVEAHESTRKCLESTLPRDHEDHIAEKGFYSINHYREVHKFIAMPQAMKIPDAKLQWMKNGRSSRKFQSGSWIK